MTPDSIRRALDAGYTASDLQQLVKRRSRTGVPQALSYAIEDVARRHGGLRLGAAGCYLRSEDAALLVEIANDRRLADLQLRTGRADRADLAVPARPGAPALRDSRLRTGAGRLRRRPGTGAPADVPGAGSAYPLVSGVLWRRHRGAPRLVSPPRLAAAVEALRAGEAAARHARRAPVSVRPRPDGAVRGQAHTQAMAVLQQAIRDKARVWVGYVDAHGATVSRLLRPVSMGGGYLRAEDERTEMLHTFALHRITAAVLDA